MQSYAQRHTKNPQAFQSLVASCRTCIAIFAMLPVTWEFFWELLDDILEVGPKVSQKDTEGLWAPCHPLPSSLPPWTVLPWLAGRKQTVPDGFKFQRVFNVFSTCFNQILPRYSWALVWGHSPRKRLTFSGAL